MSSHSKLPVGCLILMVACYLYIPLAWGANAYRLVRCDWEPSYKAEVVHGLGLFTPIFIVTAWMDLEP